MKKTNSWNRLLSLVLCICMVLSMVPGYALPALAEEAEPTCSCSVKCTEGSVNSGCPVCSAEGADLSGVCTGTEETTVVATFNIDAAAMTPEELKAAVDAALAAGYTAITVNLTEDADATMFSAIAAALAADYVADGTVDLTISGAKTVPEYGFFDNDEKNIAGDKLKSLTLTDVETIGDFAFSACTYLESVNLPQVVTIGECAFNEWKKGTKLTSLNLPNATTIGDWAFAYSSLLTSVNLPKVVTIGTVAFADCDLRTLDLPEATTIGGEAFYNNENLVSCSAPKATTIDYYPWGKCSKLEALELTAAGNFTIGNNIFELDTPTEQIDLVLHKDKESQVTQNDDGTAIWKCKVSNGGYNSNTFKSITTVHIPEADDGDCTTAVLCSGCGEMAVEAKESHTGGEATCTEKAICDICSKPYGTTPAHSFDETGKCSGCGQQATISVTDGTNTYYALDAVSLNTAVTDLLNTGARTFTVNLPATAEAKLFTAIRRAICDTEGVADGSIHLTLKGVTSIPGTTNWDGVAFGPGDIYDEAGKIVDQELVTQLASINLPDVTEIGAQAFYFFENLVSVSAPKAQTIGAQALGYTALTSVEFPELTTIPTDMFSGTWTLSSAKFPKVTTIEQGGLLVGAKFMPENNPTPFPLELTAEGNITFNGSNHFNIASQNYSGKVDLVLCCDKKDAVTFHEDGTATWQVRNDLSYTFKSITFNHSYVDGKCTDNGDGTHKATCTECGYEETSRPHTIENHACTDCGAMEIVVSFDAGDYEWKTGDTLYFCRVSGDNEWEEYAFTATVAGDGTVTWTPDRTLYWDGTGEHKLVVIYPDTGYVWDTWYVDEDQATPETLRKNDRLDAIWSGNPTTDTITFNLKHRMAKVTVNYEAAEGVNVSKAEVYTLTQYVFFDVDTLERRNIAWEEGDDLWIHSYLNDGQFTAFVSPDAYAAGGNFIKITLSDGSVREVKMNKAVTFAEGAEYTYKVVITADGAYLTCADECSFEYTANEDGLTHSKTCSKCGYVEIAAEAHTGGTATCTEKAVCDLCGASYGELDPYNHTDVTAVFEWPDNYSDYMEVYVRLNCVCGEEVDYFWVYGDAITVETLPGTDCKNPTVATCTLNDEYNGVTYTDTKTYIVPGDPHAGEFVNGFCSACGGFEEAVWNEEDYVYEIYNAGQLYWYAQQVNENNAEMTVKLMADIVIPENAPNWVSITGSYVTFDGNFHTISGVRCIGGEDDQYVGFFGNEGWWYDIKNLHITDSYFEGDYYVGALIACFSNGGNAVNCAVTNTTVKGEHYAVGGLVGYMGAHITNCYSTATVIGENADGLVGYYYSGYGEITNCYYLAEKETEDGAKTAAQFASGEVAYLLQSGILGEDIYDDDWNWIGTAEPKLIWGQTIGEDAYPVLGGDKVYQVTNCKNEIAYSNTEGNGNHSYKNGTCTVCGAADPDYEEAVVQPTLTLKAPTLEFKDMITVNAMFTAENLDSVVEMGMITYTEKVDQWSVETAKHVIPGTTYDVNTGRYIATSQGIHAKYLGDAVYLACYAKLTDGSYVYTKLASYSPVQYATSKLKGNDVPLKQLVVAMLNYGAAAQVFFGHNTQNLANAALTAEQITLPESYRSDMVSTVASADASKQGEFYNNKGFAKRYPSVSFEGAFCINYFFTPAYAPVGEITLYYWNEADYEAVDVLTTENASGSLTMELQTNGEYRADIAGIAAKALGEGVYVAGVYTNGESTWTSGVLGYSIGAYCSSQATKGGTIADLAMATAVYGYHAKAYFG